MPHNLLVTQQGALETVGLAAEAMVGCRTRSRRTSCPKTPEVLFSIRLLNPGETVRLRFTAPNAARQLSVRLHVPRPLADDERHASTSAVTAAVISVSCEPAPVM